MNGKSDKHEQLRYSAMLLFQFRVIAKGKANTMRTCEKRFIVFGADSAKAALAWARRRGREGEHSYRNGAGNPVHFEFVGVLDLICIGVECEEDEVWYDIVSLKRPMERARKLLPPERDLNAFRWETSLKSRSTRSRSKTRAPG
jgi:hypothetical protein